MIVPSVLKAVALLWASVCSAKSLESEGALGQNYKRHIEGNAYALSEVVIQPNLDFAHLGHLVKRQTAPTPLKNNVPSNRSINPGENQIWILPASELASSLPTQAPYVPEFDPSGPAKLEREHVGQELKRRQTGDRSIYINVDICNQPSASGPQPTGPPPGLNLYISHDPKNQNPGPNAKGASQTGPLGTTNGHRQYGDKESGDTYIGVSAPGLSGYTGSWTYQISVSTAADYTKFYGNSFLRFVDSDTNSSLFTTEGLAHTNDTSVHQQWLDTGGPFSLFVYNASDPMMAGVNASFCGLTTYALAYSNVPGKLTVGSESGMHVINHTSFQQFYIDGLRPNSFYQASLGLTSMYSRDINSNSPGGGGSIWQSFPFQTRINDNCQLVYNLTFCDKVAYAVPTNKTVDRQGLANFYDSNANGNLWPNFRNSLDQIPCNTSNDAKYSLARGCDDCQEAYKDWMCAVSIPRCADFQSSSPFLKIRNAKPSYGNNTWPNNTQVDTSSSELTDPWNAVARNEQIGSYMNSTGPYKEVLPCADLCYNLVQSCPSILGFACPLTPQLEWGYSSVPQGEIPASDDGYPACNYPGRIYTGNAQGSLQIPFGMTSITVIALTWLLV